MKFHYDFKILTKFYKNIWGIFKLVNGFDQNQE
jgi:hypothetical protein